MNEYIELEAAMQAVCNGCNIEFEDQWCEPGDCYIRNKLLAVPAADVAPVVHGRWILGEVEPGYLTPGGNRPWICSECGQVVSWMLGRPQENFCHNCGAKMDGGDVSP